MGKGIVLFFSMTGNNRKLAEIASREKKYDLLEMFPGNFLRVFSIPFGFWAKSEARKVNLDKYSDVIIYGPVWAGKPSPIIQELLKSPKLKGKNVWLNLTNMGGTENVQKTIDELIKSSGLKLSKLKMIELKK